MNDKLILTPKGFKTWELVEDFKVETSKGVVTVPKGFVTDLASVPRFLWWIIPPFGRYTQAGVVHDWLTWSQFFTRKETDTIFSELMIKYGTYKYKAKLMYRAVRTFGWIAWNRYKKIKK